MLIYFRYTTTTTTNYYYYYYYYYYICYYVNYIGRACIIKQRFCLHVFCQTQVTASRNVICRQMVRRNAYNMSAHNISTSNGTPDIAVKLTAK
jgi:hypothetical protein